ncbi:hypothetical protein V4C53_23280 [Paraburkholderia azotifigens]|uniref:hypothetical protein n=1 Tax=Paraburkholderia azotifigens TaxID=2057004 RepID=UPI0031733C94
MTDISYKPGDKKAAICASCKHLVDTTFFQQTDGLLVAVCDDCGRVVGIAGETEPPELAIEFYEGEYLGDRPMLTRMFVVEGSCVPYDRPPYTVLEETRRILEQYGEKYASQELRDRPLTVFISKRRGEDYIPLGRLDVTVRDGVAHTSILVEGQPRYDAEPVSVEKGDDIVAVIVRVLRDG